MNNPNITTIRSPSMPNIAGDEPANATPFSSVPPTPPPQVLLIDPPHMNQLNTGFNVLLKGNERVIYWLILEVMLTTAVNVSVNVP